MTEKGSGDVLTPPKSQRKAFRTRFGVYPLPTKKMPSTYAVKDKLKSRGYKYKYEEGYGQNWIMPVETVGEMEREIRYLNALGLGADIGILEEGIHTSVGDSFRDISDYIEYKATEEEKEYLKAVKKRAYIIRRRLEDE